MKLHAINTGNFKLDGGAMFGVVPKSIWQKNYPADDNNMCNWAMRCLLIEDGDKLILIDNGIGNKQSEKFFGHYFLNGDASLERSLKKAGFSPDDVTDMFLSHLHFDHCGGGVVKKDENSFDPLFKNATYWSHSEQWNWAINPNAREKASFLKENLMPMQESGQLKFADDKESGFNLFDFKIVKGHTESMMLPVIEYKNRKVVFCADLLPSTAHLPLPYVMAYDTRPLITLTEKAEFLNEAVKENYILFFEHDVKNQCADLSLTDKGIQIAQIFDVSEI